MPLLASTLGIDGGAVFQILAVEELGLSARAVGIAFGLGVLSVPAQLYATRMPLWRARQNLRLFLAFGAAGCAFLALVVSTAGFGSRLAFSALALTVLAEIALSVLYATAWQPLLSHGLPAAQRQQVNARWRAAGSAFLAAVLVVFGVVSTGWRVLVICLVAAAAVVMLLAARRFAAPDRPPRPPPGASAGAVSRPPLPPGIRPIYLALALTGFSGWPLFLIYSRDVLWPAANLGLVGAVQLAGSLAAAVAWRATSTGLIGRARIAAGTLALVSGALALLQAPVDGRPEEALVLVLFGVAALSTSTILLALMELAHQQVSQETSVRTLTLFDVVISTSFQAGFLAAGFLVAASRGSQAWTDPYRLCLAAATVGLLGVVLRLRPDKTDGDRPAAAFA